MNGDAFVNKDDPELPMYLVQGSPTANKHKRGLYYHEEEETEHEIVSEHSPSQYDGGDDADEDYFHDEDEDDLIQGAHSAAADGDMDALHEFARDDPDALHAEDENGWKVRTARGAMGLFCVVQEF